MERTQFKKRFNFKKMFILLFCLISLWIAVSACGGGSDSGGGNNNNWDSAIWDQSVWQ